MAKFYGIIGFADYLETRPGVTEPVIEERYYSGNVIKNTRRLEAGEGLNDDVNISNQFSIVADQYAYKHFYSIQYIEYMGVRWKVTNVEVQSPRLILNVGGVYNGNENPAP